MGRPKGVKSSKKNFRWKEDHLNFLRTHYIKMQQRELLIAFNEKFNAKINLTTLVGALKRNQIKSDRTGVFKKGSQPWNKGWNCWADKPEVFEKIKATQYKKGSLPHNVNKEGNGAITQHANGYYYIRHSLGNWKPLHRHIWKEANGEPGEGLIIVFKDGNPQNCIIQNLEAIDRKEHYLRNNLKSDEWIVHQMAGGRNPDPILKKALLEYTELIEIQRQKYLLNRKLKEHENSNPKEG